MYDDVVEAYSDFDDVSGCDEEVGDWGGWLQSMGTGALQYVRERQAMRRGRRLSELGPQYGTPGSAVAPRVLASPQGGWLSNNLFLMAAIGVGAYLVFVRK